MGVELICTFVFVIANLLVKDAQAGKFSHTVGEAYVGFMGCAIIASALAGMIVCAGPWTGASLNPAVSIA